MGNQLPPPPSPPPPPPILEKDFPAAAELASQMSLLQSELREALTAWQAEHSNILEQYMVSVIHRSALYYSPLGRVGVSTMDLYRPVLDFLQDNPTVVGNGKFATFFERLSHRWGSDTQDLSPTCVLIDTILCKPSLEAVLAQLAAKGYGRDTATEEAKALEAPAYLANEQFYCFVYM